jgi:hypothetical protein
MRTASRKSIHDIPALTSTFFLRSRSRSAPKRAANTAL